jgi:hypothetical protein
MSPSLSLGKADLLLSGGPAGVLECFLLPFRRVALCGTVMALRCRLPGILRDRRRARVLRTGVVARMGNTNRRYPDSSLSFAIVLF